MSDTEMLDEAIDEIEATINAQALLAARRRASGSRPSRQKLLPARLIDSELCFDEIAFDTSRPVIVKCCQTGKKLTVKVKDLSREDSQSLTVHDLTNGASLILNHKEKFYPVQFLEYKEKTKTTKGQKTKKRNKELSKGETSLSSKEQPVLKDKTNVLDMLNKAKDQTDPPMKRSCLDPDTAGLNDLSPMPMDMPTCKDTSSASSSISTVKTMLDNPDKDLILQLSKKIVSMEKKLDTACALLKNIPGLDVRPEDKTVKGINVMKLPTRDAYSFALQLLDLLFTKEEQAGSLMFKSKKSEKPALDEQKVAQLIELVQLRFGNDWNMKTLQAKVNQKCRDSKVMSTCTQKEGVSDDEYDEE